MGRQNDPPPVLMTFLFVLPEGAVEVRYVGPLSADSFDDLTEYFALILRTAKRQTRQVGGPDA